MAEEKKQERSFELRSEKVRSIVGQIPSSLVRYRISVIGLVLCVLVGVAYLLPYKQVYSGVATIYKLPLSMLADSTDVQLLLRFDNKRMGEVHTSLPIQLQTSNKDIIDGRMEELTAARDTLERQTSLCRFATHEIKPLDSQSVDFKITYASGNLLKKMLGGL